MRIGKSAVYALTFVTMTLAFAACGAGAVPTETGCFDTVDGAVMSVPATTEAWTDSRQRYRMMVRCPKTHQ